MANDVIENIQNKFDTLFPAEKKLRLIFWKM